MYNFQGSIKGYRLVTTWAPYAELNAKTVIGSLENIEMDVSVEGSSMVMGSMGDWDYTVTIDNGEADGYTTIISYTIVEKQ